MRRSLLYNLLVEGAWLQCKLDTCCGGHLFLVWVRVPSGAYCGSVGEGYGRLVVPGSFPGSIPYLGPGAVDGG